MTTGIQDCTTLNNGVEMPWLGFGVCRIEAGEDVENAVRAALDAGYRSIDTASIYMNERGVGNAIRQSGILRDEIFLTTKVWNDDQREGNTLAAFERSLSELNTDYVDLYLVHWPVDGCYLDTWLDLEEIYASGRARAIGVSNFLPRHLDELRANCSVIPSVNQVELHPYLLQNGLREYCRGHGIQMEAWSPLMQGHIADEQSIVALAQEHSKSPSQIVLRWHLQHQVVAIPKSVNADRIAENTQIFDFELSEDEMQQLDALDKGRHFGPGPDNFDF